MDCEYMTGGKVIVLGETGNNFAAGMSGGMAYVFDQKNEFPEKVNMEMVGLESLAEDDLKYIHEEITNHVKYTDSKLGKLILDDWGSMAKYFVKVMPNDLKRVLEERKLEEQEKVA